ncbi:RNA polymerase sigma factor [Clostridium thermarum]|uniref:RNA polymerase sigma factor n=1 Tax=Clostridium thermarum TaxID=1716543 RepID=UPI0013D74598|nr:sigma-70 family RNA polymerase sigma factor [Clostridium thermarum]
MDYIDKQQDTYFEELYNKYNRVVFNHISMSIKDYWQAEDLTSEVFIKVYKHRDKINDIEKSGKWVITIAKNTLIDYYRKTKREVPSEDIDVEAHWEQGYDNLLIKDDFERVRDALDQLNSVEKKMVDLRYYYGMKHKDIAKIMNMTESAARAKLGRTINKLKVYGKGRYPNAS